MASRDFTVDEPDQVIPKTSRKIYVALSESGNRMGETHPRANLTDHEVDLIRELREKDGLTYEAIAEKFECGKSVIQKICNYTRRAETPARYKVIVLHYLNPPEGGTNERPDHQSRTTATDSGPAGSSKRHRKAGLPADAERVLADVEV